MRIIINHEKSNSSNDDGVFANAILLKKTLHEGLYMLVAYTRYMLNFPEKHVRIQRD
ncbi:MAG: hypothetical protein MJZ29_08835 [Bacteroidaceae bacterium]|nr:hypothetical protein [Bacteroidaceae bacterium]